MLQLCWDVSQATLARSLHNLGLGSKNSGLRTLEHYMTPFLSFLARTSALLTMVVMPSAAFAQTEQQGSGPITNAVLWMQSVLLGPIATSLAVMAVAAVGFMMLTGRMNWRFGATVIIGVFIIFGAPVIVSGIAATS